MRRPGQLTPIPGAAIPRPKPAPPHAATSLIADPLRRVPWLVGAFWAAVLTLALISHVMRSPDVPPPPNVLHGYQHFTLAAKVNMLMPSAPPYTSLLSYRVCCQMAGGHMECPDAREAECQVMRDEGPRLACFWVAPRLEGATCVLYWVSARALPLAPAK